MATVANAQWTESDPETIRQDTERILSSPEFRHLRRFDEAKELPDVTVEGNSETRRSGSSGNDEKSPGNRRENGNSAGERNSDNSSSQQDESSITLPSAGGALGSLFGLIFHVLAWTALAAVCALIVYLVVRAIGQGESVDAEAMSETSAETADEANSEHPPGELPADQYVARAHELAALGRYREATAQLLFGAMSFLERSRRIRYRQGLTFRDYLRAAGDEPRLRRPLRKMIGLYEPLGFGRREATRKHFETCLANYEAAFGAETHGHA